MSQATTAQVAAGVATFFENELVPNLTGWQLWAASAALAVAKTRAEDMVKVIAANPIVAALGVVDDSGMVDVGTLVSAMKETAKTHGKLELDIPGIGKIKLGDSDFDKLLKYIEEE